MKKKKVIKIIMVAAMIVQGSSFQMIWAEEINESSNSIEQNDSNKEQSMDSETLTMDSTESETKETQSNSSVNEINKEELEKKARLSDSEENITGVYGSVPWVYGPNRTLHFYEGEFPKTSYGDNIYFSIIEKFGLSVDNIKFEEKVIANQDSSYLFSRDRWGISSDFSIENLHLLDTSNVTNMSGMFALIPNHYSIVDLSNFDTSNVTNMQYMFSHSDFQRLNLSNFDTSNVTNMSEMFKGMEYLTNLDISNFDMSNVSEGSTRMFKGVYSLETLVLGNKSYDYTTKNLVGSELPDKTADYYTGRWVLENTNDPLIYSSSEEFMNNYNGSRPGRYVSEKTVFPTGITLDSDLSLNSGEEASLNVTVIPDNAMDKSVLYFSSDSTVATVSKDGVVKALKEGKAVITVITRANSDRITATSTVTVKDQGKLVVNPFYLGIDDHVVGTGDYNQVRKVQLMVNNQLVSTSRVTKAGDFALDAQQKITDSSDKVEVIALDRKNQVLSSTQVAVQQQNYKVTVNPFILNQDTQITGKTDSFHSAVALWVNGEEVARQNLFLDREFSFDTEDFIEYDDDEVEIVGYNFNNELTRTKVDIVESEVAIIVRPYKIGDPLITGNIVGELPTQVRLYVNGRITQTVLLKDDGTFELSGIFIFTPLDRVSIVALNANGVELSRESITPIQ